MQNPPNCATCHAPLPPGAHQCAYCKTATPLGIQAAHHQQQIAAAHAMHQQHAQAAAAAHRKRLNFTTAMDNAKWGFVLGLVGVPICCAPVSLVGAVLGVRAIRIARAEHVAPPTRAYLAIVLGLVSTVLLGTAITLGVLDSREKAERLEAVQKRLAGKREAERLDAKVACDLVEERLIEDGHDGHSSGLGQVRCDGALAAEGLGAEGAVRRPGAPNVEGARATLPNVRVAWSDNEPYDLTGCFYRGSRWFVLKIARAGESCGAGTLVMPPLAGAPGEETLRAQEKRAREDYAKAEAEAAVKAYLDGLRRVRDQAARTGGLAETECPRDRIRKHLTAPGERLKVETVDYDWLDRKSGDAAPKQWVWMTSSRMKTLLGGDAAKKTEAIRDLRKESGPLLVVYRGDRKIWPKVHDEAALLGNKFSYDGGEFAGWMLVFDVDTGERLCQAKLVFENSDEISYKKGVSSEKTRAVNAVEEDFEERFEDAATEAMKRISPEMRLGYKVLE